jgi:Uma2 family endonuclease
MATQSVPFVTPEEYFKFDRESEFRHEYVFGEIVRVTGATYNHSLITANTLGTLRNLLSSHPCRVLDTGIRVMLYRDALYSYPDVTVVCGNPEFPVRDGICQYMRVLSPRS